MIKRCFELHNCFYFLVKKLIQKPSVKKVKKTSEPSDDFCFKTYLRVIFLNG